MTGLMLLQIESSNSASILLIQIWLQLSVWATRDDLIGGYLYIDMSMGSRSDVDEVGREVSESF